MEETDHMIRSALTLWKCYGFLICIYNRHIRTPTPKKLLNQFSVHFQKRKSGFPNLEVLGPFPLIFQGNRQTKKLINLGVEGGGPKLAMI